MVSLVTALQDATGFFFFFFNGSNLVLQLQASYPKRMETSDFVSGTGVSTVSLLSPQYKPRLILSCPGDSYGTTVELRLTFMKQQGLRVW